jgi:HEAT repeat protein
MEGFAGLEQQTKPPFAAARAIPVLAARLSDSLPENRKAAAESLGDLGPLAHEAASALQKGQTTMEPRAVRNAAEKALKSIQ